MLKTIYGRRGTGKTETLRKYLYDAVAATDESKTIVIVPEQNSFQAEKRLLDDLGAQKATRVTVLSFRRLYDRLVERYGERTERRIDDGDKAVLMSIAIRQVTDQLTMYNTKSNKNDVVELMLGAVNECKMCAVTPSDLLERAGKTKNIRLAQKLKECALIFEAYNALIENTYSDPDDDMTYVYRMLCEHQDYFAGKTVYIDAFNGFSGQEQKVLKCILTQADDVYITLGCDKVPAAKVEDSVFAEPCKTKRDLERFANEQHIPVEDQFLEKPVRFKTDSLQAVEESVFNFDGDRYDNDGSVQLYQAEDETDEVQQVCRDILKLVQTEDYAYRDITVISRDLSPYECPIETEFDKYGIPFFMSIPQVLESKPLIRLVLGAFDVVHSSFDTENVLAYLKTGLTDILEEDIFRLENYVYMWDIQRKDWHQPFTMNPDGNTPNLNEEKLKHLEELRQQIVMPLEQFGKAISVAENGGEISRAVFKLLEKVHVAEQIRLLVKSLEEHHQTLAVQEQIRIWDIMMNMLDKMYYILENMSVDSKRYAELLQLMIQKSPVSDIPQTLDSVTIGTAGNIRSENPKAVFVIGAIKDIFPCVPTESGIFTDRERVELIDELELPLYDGLYGASLKEKYIAYSSLTDASEYLYVSFYSHNTKGEACKPSEIVTELENMFDGLKVRTYDSLSDEDLFYTKRQSYELCALEWNQNTTRSESLKKYFEQDKEYAPCMSSVENAVKDAPFIISKPEVAHKLFGANMELSASKIDTYYQCPFAYFCRYGLRINKRKKADMDSMLYGNVVHYVLERLLQDDEFKKLQSSDKEQLKSFAEKYLKDYMDNIGGEEKRTARFQAQCRNMVGNIVAVLQHLIQEFEHSDFKPTDFELNIGEEGEHSIPAYELKLSDKETVRVVGKVDRVDTYVQGNEKYIRVVDYKTGSKDFNITEVQHGLNLQMLLYLSAIIENGKKHYMDKNDKTEYTLKPAGVLYMPSTPDFKTADSHDDTAIRKVLKGGDTSLRMNGLLVKEESVVNAMDKKATNRFVDRSKAVSDEEFQEIFETIKNKVVDMAKTLRKGDIKRYPVKAGKIDACQYCEYQTICRYEKGKAFNNMKDEETTENTEDNQDSEKNDLEAKNNG